jgi:hypothetical protein
MSWGSRRKTKIILYFLLILFFIIGSLVIHKIRNIKPTCFDQKQNGDELGIDCGGVCQLECKSLMQEENILWQRSYEIDKGFYNSVAYIENQNVYSGVKKVNYAFKLFDKNRILIAERSGETYIEQNRAFVVFEQNIPVGEKIPVYTTFEFTSQIFWHRVDQNVKDMNIEVLEMNLNREDIKPRFEAKLNNLSVKQSISNIDVYVVLYDANDNVIQVGKTFVPELKAREKKNIFVVWKKDFDVVPVRYEVIARYNPFKQVFVK